MRRVTIGTMMMLGVLAVGCGGGQKKVGRVSSDTQTDLSGNWNDTDAKLTSEALIKDCFATAWLPKFKKENSRAPKIRVTQIVNKTDEHIDAQIFIKNIERAMVNSGEVEVLAQKSEREAAREEQDEGASGRISDESAASIGNEEGADFVVVARMASIVDQVEGKKAKFYKINFELLGASSAKKVWIGDHEIKKVIEQASSSW
jgi:penicillin-binding protein activator